MRNTITTKMLFTVLTLTAAAQTTLAQQTNSQNSAPAQGKIVHFPPDRSMGTLYIQDEGIINLPWAFSKWDDSPEDQWKILCPAQGDVLVPPGKRLSLNITKNIWKDLSPLKNLKPNDLYSLTIYGQLGAITNPNDICMPHIAHLTGLKDLSLKWTNISTKGLQSIKDFHSLEYLFLPTRIDDSTMIFISRFKSLKGLYFSRTGQVTDEGLAALQQLPNLEEITFDGLRKITAMSLRQLSKIPSLKKLAFHGHSSHNRQFTDEGLIYLKDMPQLKTLMLDDTNITDSGLQFFSNLHQLEELDLFNTPVTDAGIPHLIALKSLRRLNLRKRPASNMTFITEKAVPHLAQIPTLEYLELNYGCLSDLSAPEIAKLPKLKFLYAWGSNVLTNSGLGHLAKIKSLEFLSTRSHYITDEGMDAIAQFPNLKTLSLTCPKITDQGLSLIANMKNLQNLSLTVSLPGNSEESYITISGVACLNEMTNLKSLALDGVNQDGSGLNISQLKNLESLTMYLKSVWPPGVKKRPKQDKSFQDIDLQCLANLKHLKQLHLRCSRDITDKGLMHLKGLTDLETIDLSEASLTDAGLAYLKDMKKLNDLRIGGNFTEYGLQHLKELKSLDYLWLYTDYGIPNRAVRELKKSLPCLTSFELKTK
jgi:hypothetical protein